MRHVCSYLLYLQICMCLLVFLSGVHATVAFPMQGDRYDGQRAVIGSKLQGKLQDMQVLVIAYIRHCNALLSMTVAKLWTHATAAICCIKFSGLADNAACQLCCLALNCHEWLQLPCTHN